MFSRTPRPESTQPLEFLSDDAPYFLCDENLPALQWFIHLVIGEPTEDLYGPSTYLAYQLGDPMEALYARCK